MTSISKLFMTKVFELLVMNREAAFLLAGAFVVFVQMGDAVNL